LRCDVTAGRWWMSISDRFPKERRTSERGEWALAIRITHVVCNNCSISSFFRQGILTVLVTIAVITNAGLIVFALDIFPKGYSTAFQYWVFILFQWILFFLQVCWYE
jgi:hypothetical protein